MSLREPSDSSARELAIRRPGRSLILEAGAGTGKTATMVARIVAGVRQGIPLRKHVAITFTVKAAWELQTRLRLALQSAGLPDVSEEIGEMRIGTIDAIVQGILQRFPVESGLPGGFRLISGQEFGDRFEAWYRSRMPIWSSDPDLADAWETLATLEFRQRTIEAALRTVARLTAVGGAATRLVGADFDIRRHIPAVEADLRVADAMIPEGKLRPIAEQNVVTLHDSLENLAANAFEMGEQLISMGNFGGRDAKPCRDAIKAIGERIDELRAATLFARIAPLLQAAIRDAELFAIQLTDEGLLNFDQALARCIALLERAEVREMLREEIASVMIDEFQDTSPNQVRLAQLLCDADGPPLFVVGDPKQSIYRFRGADLDGYLAFRDRSEIARAQLLCNFRSHRSVLNLVNSIFRARFAESPGYEDLQAFTFSDGVIASHAIVFGGECPDADDARSSEAESTVAAISQALAGGWSTWRNAEPGSGRAEPLRLSDIAVLYPRRRILPDLRAQLALAGIPYRIEDRTSLAGSDELRAVVNVLRAAGLAPDDDVRVRAIARQAAARSLAFGTRIADPIGDVAADLDGIVAKIRDRLPSEAVTEIVDSLGIGEFAGGSPRPRATLNRIHALIARALAAEAEGVTTIEGFVALLDGDHGDDIRESPAVEGDEDAVRLMTVHAAKGLEFPMVIVAGFGSNLRSPDPILRLANGDLWATVGIGGDRIGPLGRDLVNSAEIEADQKETERLLYVAMTRAKEHLVVSACHGKRSNSLAKDLRGGGLFDDHLHEFGPPVLIPVSTEPISFCDTAGVLEAWKAVRQSEARTTPTRLADSKTPQDPDTFESEAELTDSFGDAEFAPSLASKRSTAFGRSVHLALQELDFSTLNIEEVAASAASRYGFSPERVETAVRRAAATEPFQEALNSRHVLREVYAASLLPDADDTLLEGIIDLIYERSDGTIAIVDYKTDRVFNERDALARVASGYRAQGEAYRQLVGKATRKTISRVAFVFLGPNPAVVVEIAPDPTCDASDT